MISIEEARHYYTEHDSAHAFDHVLRVLALAEHIAQAEGADLEIVRTAALLHDIGRAEESRTGLDHALIGAEQAREILRGHPPDRVEAVVEAIATHRFRADRPPQSLEAKVLFDADKLDAIGAVGVARAFMLGGKEGQPLWRPVPTDYDGSPVEDYSPVHEFVFKLSKLRDRMLTPTGRRLAERRHRIMVDFFIALEEEVLGRA